MYGHQLWKSDGTSAGTSLVKDINSSTSGSNPGFLTNVNGTLYFRANDGSSGIELWKSDGTSADTALVKDTFPGSFGANPSNLANANGTLYFRANGTSGYELWKSDGTSAGTSLVKDIRPGFSSSNPSYLTNVNGTLFFSANDGTSGVELWKDDVLAPAAVSVTPSINTVTDAQVGSGTFTLSVVFSESMDTAVNPTLSFPAENPGSTLSFASGSWLNATTYVATYNVADANVALPNIDVQVPGAQDVAGNTQATSTNANKFNIDTAVPTVVSVTASVGTVSGAQVGSDTFSLTVVFSEAMNTTVNPTLSFPTDNPGSTLSFASGMWLNATTYVASYNVNDSNVALANIDVQVAGTADVAGNTQATSTSADKFSINTTHPTVSSIVRLDRSSTRLTVVRFKVTFTRPVSGVDIGDFRLVKSTTLRGTTIVSVQRLSATVYIVRVRPGIGRGWFGLNLFDNDSIRDGIGNALGGLGVNNGSFTGPRYLKT